VASPQKLLIITRQLFALSISWASGPSLYLAGRRNVRLPDEAAAVDGIVGAIDKLLALDDEEKANAAPPLPETPVSR